MDILLVNGARAAGLLDAMEKEALLRTAVVRLVEAARMWRTEMRESPAPQDIGQGGTEIIAALIHIDNILFARGTNHEA